MAKRTIKIAGLAYGPEAAVIKIAANENEVFSGVIPNSGTLTPTRPANGEEVVFDAICTFDIDLDFSGELLMSYQVMSGNVILEKIFSNLALVPNPGYTAEHLAVISNPDTSLSDLLAIYTPVADPSLTTEEMDILLDPATPDESWNNILSSHKLHASIPGGVDDWDDISQDRSDPRKDVKINGVSVDDFDREDLTGTWWWRLSAGSILTHSLTVPPLSFT